jgi:hypothetical protein
MTSRISKGGNPLNHRDEGKLNSQEAGFSSLLNNLQPRMSKSYFLQNNPIPVTWF